MTWKSEVEWTEVVSVSQSAAGSMFHCTPCQKEKAVAIFNRKGSNACVQSKVQRHEEGLCFELNVNISMLTRSH